MNIWILDSDSGLTLLYKAYMDLSVNEDLVSGLLTALNQLTIVEFHGQGIESIDMGGLRWVYVRNKDLNLLFIAAANKGEKAEMLRARLNVIKQSFVQEYAKTKEDWTKKWIGNVEIFKPFEKTLDEYYSSWLAAESVTSVAEFFDILGVFQQLFFDLLAILNRVDKFSREKIYKIIETMFVKYRNNDYVKGNPELEKICFSRESGINIITINPSNCDMLVVEKQLINLMKKVVLTFKQEIGLKDCINFFIEENIFTYILNNISLLNQLNLDKFFLQLFLID